eukprot:scaffold16330_cov61-Phaeocystis_antarctica.AAC.1
MLDLKDRSCAFSLIVTVASSPRRGVLLGVAHAPAAAPPPAMHGWRGTRLAASARRAACPASRRCAAAPAAAGRATAAAAPAAAAAGGGAAAAGGAPRLRTACG